MCRYTTILAPAIHMIQQRLSLNTADHAQTPQQEQFVSKHLPALKQAAAAFAHPTDDVLMHPELAWNTFKAVSRAIAQQLRYAASHCSLQHMRYHVQMYLYPCTKVCDGFSELHSTSLASTSHHLTWQACQSCLS